MESITSSEKVLVCETCGDEGFTNAFVYCVKCLGFVIHRYCLHVIPRTTDEFVYWFCEDCKPPVPYKSTLPKPEPSQSRKKDATSLALKKTTHRKRKQKKRNLGFLLARKAIVPDHEHISPTIYPLKEASGPNQIAPCVVSQLENGVQLDNKCSPLKKSAKTESNGRSSMTVKTKDHRTKKTADSVEHSLCDSSCTDVASKNQEGMAHSVEEHRCETQQSQTSHDKLDYTGQAETANQMHNEQYMRAAVGVGAGDGAGAGASQSADYQNSLQYMYYQPARPVVDPVWRGSFNITQTDYDLFEGFVGHISSKACYKVCEEASMLPSLLSLEMHPAPALWPKSFVESQPSDENIALYFFPGDTKNERDFERLVVDMIDGRIAMRAIGKNAELLIFTSTVLPRLYRRFQGKYYLWGVFRGKRNDRDVAVSNSNSDNQVTNGNETLTRLKGFDSRSPQSPLCNYSQEASVRDMTSKFGKLEKFQGNDFRRWQKKMHFLLTTLKVVYVLSTPIPEVGEDETMEMLRRINKWDNDDYICRSHILNGMCDALFDIYQNVESAKELWDALESKYMTEDASSKKFLVSNFNNYKMVDSRPVMEQYNELFRILGQFTQHHMKMDESILVSSIIDKLPRSWKDFKHTLKHQKEEISLVQLGSHLRIEESLRAQESGKAKDASGPSTVNIVEERTNSNKKMFDKGKKRKFDDHKHIPNKKSKMTCWVCGKIGHFKRDCRMVKGNKNGASSSGARQGSKDQNPNQG